MLRLRTGRSDSAWELHESRACCFRWYDQGRLLDMIDIGKLGNSRWCHCVTAWWRPLYDYWPPWGSSVHLTVKNVRFPTCLYNTSSYIYIWYESGFRPPLCTYRLNWARRTSWGWWDDWDDTVLQTQDSKFEPWRSEAEHATSRSRRLPTILTFTRGWEYI